ncbi:MAG: lytic transglycosylase domain-containing protein [Roseburia sp.]|nr:lytic transglycosylase domain-containing protein [Roseburia sp.]
MALTVNGISAYQQSEMTPQKAATGKTSITPFSDVLKYEEKQISKTAKANTAEETSSAGAVSTGSQTAGNVAATNGTTGTVNANGSLATTLDDIFRRASEKYGVSYDFLVAVAKAESDFNPNCVSSAGAKGIMQIMPEEAKELGISDVFDAEQNIMGAAKLLAAHLEKFDGDTTLAAAAYNAGSGRVKQYGGVPPFKETQNYVKKIASYLEKGVSVPEKTLTVTPNKLSGDVTKSQGTASSSGNGLPAGLNAVAATEEEMNNSMVVVGTGDSAVTMTYGAYQRYLELGSLGVG